MSEAAVVSRGERARSAPTLLGLSISGALSLAAVVAVLLVVSVPRLHGIALQENEADAKVSAALLARELGAGPAPSLRELLRRREVAGLTADADLLAGGRLLRRHGYLFEVTHLDPAWSAPDAPLGWIAGRPDALRPAPAIRAWPWRYGATGRSAFLVTANGALLAHPNEGRWQGVEAAGAGPAELHPWTPGPGR